MTLDEATVVKQSAPRYCRGTDFAECPELRSISFPWQDEGAFIVTTDYKAVERGLVNHTSDSAVFTYRSEILPTDTCRVGVVFPDFTWQAYNNWGGRSLYSRPYPLPGTPSSKVSSAQRPIAFPSPVHSPEATLIFSQKLREEGVCHYMLSNSDLHDSIDWKNLDLIVLTGHDEYWSVELRANLEAFVEAGGRLSIFSGNTAWWEFNRIGLDAYQRVDRWSLVDPPDEFIGLSYRYGGLPGSAGFSDPAGAEAAGLPPGLFDVMNGMKVLRPDHQIFLDTGLAKSEFFGFESDLMDHEIDGVPLNPADSTRDFDRESWAERHQEVPQTFPESLHVLAAGWVQSNGEFRYVGTIVESEYGKGKVLNLGSVGWSSALRAGDEIVEAIFLNSVRWQLSGES